jgi:hypothetical protein
MNRATPKSGRLEGLLAGTLHYGTWLASAVIALGLALALLESRLNAPTLAIRRDMRIATIGIALFILLPVVRVIVMFIVYLRQRDYRLSAIALLVLTIILLGFALGLAGSKHHDTGTSPMRALRQGTVSTVPSPDPKNLSSRTAAGRFFLQHVFCARPAEGGTCFSLRLPGPVRHTDL